jgi:hypothetical protein
LDLKDDLDALERGRYGCRGDGGEEACGGELADCERLLGGGGNLADECFSYIVAPERDGN